MRVAYVSHVDSKWIKQRPHFIAESLRDAKTRVTFVCSMFAQKKRLVSSQRLNVPVLRVPMLPQRFRSKLRFLDPVGSYLSALLILGFLRPTHVICTHSRHHRLARVLKKAGVNIYYDCMDLNGLFADVLSSDSRDELELVSSSKAVFCSSEVIVEHIQKLNKGTTTVVVGNALHPPSLVKGGRTKEEPSPRTFGYVGAISAWFDFDAILGIVNSMDDVNVILWGPCDVQIPSHERILYRGVLPHDEAVAAMQSCTVLLLPFVINDLVRAVDPVKVYEYIATGRPVLVRDYPQLSHFGDFVNRYSDVPELITKARCLVDAPPTPPALVNEFITSNAWSVRARTIKEWLD